MSPDGRKKDDQRRIRSPPREHRSGRPKPSSRNRYNQPSRSRARPKPGKEYYGYGDHVGHGDRRRSIKSRRTRERRPRSDRHRQDSRGIRGPSKSSTESLLGSPSYHGCILLYGPPGCGKTYFLRSTANEFKLPTEFVICRNLLEDFKEGVKTQLYFKKLFARARETAPSMIILDDIDEITSRKSLKDVKIRKAVYQLLRELDRLKPGDRLLISATSDKPYLIEPNLFKARRFDKLIFVPMPNQEARQELFRLYLNEFESEGNINFKSLGRITKGYSGVDIENVVESAERLAEEDNTGITMELLENAVKDYESSLTPEILEPMKQFFMRYKSGALLREPTQTKPKVDWRSGSNDEEGDEDKEDLQFEIDEVDIDEEDEDEEDEDEDEEDEDEEDEDGEDEDGEDEDEEDEDEDDEDEDDEDEDKEDEDEEDEDEEDEDEDDEYEDYDEDEIDKLDKEIESELRNQSNKDDDDELEELDELDEDDENDDFEEIGEVEEIEEVEEVEELEDEDEDENENENEEDDDDNIYRRKWVKDDFSM